MDKKLGDILTIAQFSVCLGIPKLTLCELVREGNVPSQKVGRHWLFRKESAITNLQ